MERLFFRKKKLNKKGSHVGIILSFTIFVTALIFIFAFFGSVMKTQIDKKDKLEYLQEDLMNQISETLVIVNLNDVSATGGCSQISNPTIGFTPVNVLSVDSSGSEFASTVSGSYTYFDSGKGFSKLYYYSSGLTKTKTSGTSGCATILAKTVEYKDVILESKIDSFLTLVDTDYETAKTDLEVGLDDEFSIEFIDAQGTSSGEDTRDLQTEIFAKEIDINYLDNNGKEKEGKLVLRIW